MTPRWTAAVLVAVGLSASLTAQAVESPSTSDVATANTQQATLSRDSSNSKMKRPARSVRRSELCMRTFCRYERWASLSRASRSATRHALRRKPRSARSSDAQQSGRTCAPSSQESWIITRESGGDVHAYNPEAAATGHAFGLGQLTDQIRTEAARATGIPANTVNYCEQLRLMRWYIAQRYGSAAAAVGFWQAHGWY